MNERLEEIKEWYEFNHDKSDWKVVSIRRKDFKWLIEQVELYDEMRQDAISLYKQNKRYREAWKKAKIEAKEYGAEKADEDIRDDGKEDAYNQGAQDMYDDFVYEYERALEGESE